jgi:hypothetical protein
MMILVKNQMEKGYKGRATLAVDRECPCRECFICHDCGYRASNGKWIVKMYCATNFNKGCPNPKPEPIHILGAVKYKKFFNRTCLRCGISLTKQRTNDSQNNNIIKIW